MPVNYYRYRY